MSTQPLDFSDLGGKPVSSGSIDFSDLGGKEVKPSFWDRFKDRPSEKDDTLLREVQSFGGNLNPINIGKSVYHAFADDPTQEEIQEAGGPQEVQGAKRIGLGIGRLTAQPVVNAARWYNEAAQGKHGDLSAVESQMLDVAPEAIGAGAAAPVAGKLIEGAPKLIDAVRDADLSGVSPALRAKAGALGKTAAADLASRVPVAGRLVRRPSIFDYWNAAKAKPAAVEPHVYPGAPEPTAAPEHLNPSLVSPARTMPGDVSPEVVAPPVRPTAQPIPPRSGLALPAAPAGAELGDLPATGARPAAQTGEALATRPKLVDQVQAYRTRSAGEQGIPYRPESHAQATMSEEEAAGYMPGREEATGMPQELVGVDLSQSPGFSVRPGPGGSDWVKFHGDVPESAITPRLVDQVRAGAPPAAEFSGDLSEALAQQPASKANLGELLEKGLGGKRLEPNVPLKEQMMRPRTGQPSRFAGKLPQEAALSGDLGEALARRPEGEHLGQFARANGLELDNAIPKTPAGDALRAKIHGLTNLQLRQLMISAGEDMGQVQIGNSKFRNDLPRQAALSQLMKKMTPDQIGQAIDQGLHLPKGDLQSQLEESLRLATGNPRARQ